MTRAALRKWSSLNLYSLISIYLKKKINKQNLSAPERHLSRWTLMPVWLLIKTDGYKSIKVHMAWYWSLPWGITQYGKRGGCGQILSLTEVMMNRRAKQLTCTCSLNSREVKRIMLITPNKGLTQIQCSCLNFIDGYSFILVYSFSSSHLCQDFSSC